MIEERISKTSRDQMINAKVSLVNKLDDKMKIFAITVVFKASGERANEDVWLREYQRVIMKINKKLSRHSTDCRSYLKAPKKLPLVLRNLIVHENHRKLSVKLQQSVLKQIETVYEFDEHSKFRYSRDKCKPHHIHGIIGIPVQLVPRLWDVDRDCLVARLQKDLASMSSVSSFLIERVREGHVEDWINYINKGKSLP